MNVRFATWQTNEEFEVEGKEHYSLYTVKLICEINHQKSRSVAAKSKKIILIYLLIIC